jgi:hypothetical protein
MGRLTKVLIVLAVLLVIVLVTGVFVARSAGARETIEEWIERRLGTDVEIEATRIGLPYELVIENVVSVDHASSGEPLLSIKEIRVGLGKRTRWHVGMDGVKLNLSLTRDGVWQPKGLAALGELPRQDAGMISRLTHAMRRRVSLTLNDCRMRWFDDGGVERARAQGLSFRMAPVKMPKREMYFYRVSIFSARYADGSEEQDVEKEWLAADSRDFVEIVDSSRESRVSHQLFWKVQKDRVRDGE